MESSLRRITRVGVYGVIMEADQILLITKRAGCDRGLFDLPGGGMEFGETHEEALRREFAEEVAMEFSSWRLFDAVTHTREVRDGQEHFLFYQLAHLYIVDGWKNMPHVTAEEEFGWHPLHSLRKEQLTPLARTILDHPIICSRAIEEELQKFGIQV